MTPPDHLMAGLTVGAVYSSICGIFSIKRVPLIPVFLLCGIFAMFPDADAFRGVYSSADPFTGHRGITHSILFVFSVSMAFVLFYASSCAALNYLRRKTAYKREKFLLIDLFFLLLLSGFSHLIMDLPQPPGVWKGIPLLFPMKISGVYVRSGGWSNIGWYDYRITYLFFISVMISFILLTVSILIKRRPVLNTFFSLLILLSCMTFLFIITDYIRHSSFKGSREWNSAQNLYLEEFHPAIRGIVRSGRLVIFSLIK